MFLFFWFFVFLKIEKKTCFPLKKAFLLFIILCFPLFLFGLFGASSFLTFSFLVSLLFFSFFLPFCFSFLYFVLAFSFCFVCFFLSSCSSVFSACCLVVFLNHNLRFVFALHLVSCCCCFLFFTFIFGYFLILETYQKHLWKTRKFQKQQKSKMQKKNGHFDKNSWHRCVHK